MHRRVSTTSVADTDLTIALGLPIRGGKDKLQHFVLQVYKINFAALSPEVTHAQVLEVLSTTWQVGRSLRSFVFHTQTQNRLCFC